MTARRFSIVFICLLALIALIGFCFQRDDVRYERRADGSCVEVRRFQTPQGWATARIPAPEAACVE